MRSLAKAEHVLSMGSELGEGPVWHPDEHALFWVDIVSSRVYRFEPSTLRFAAFDTSLPVTALGLRAKGGWVAATAQGLAFCDPECRIIELVSQLEPRAKTRFNDGAVDCGGRFWAGTMCTIGGRTATDGCLFRLDPNGSIQTMATGFGCSNGIGWSPDNRTMYFTDTSRGVIYAYDSDPNTGSIANRRPFVRTPANEGYPDGLTVDSEGYVWSARWGGWKVVRYDPDGKAEREIALPVSNVSSCTFGGENLDELYITTAWQSLSPESRSKQPLAGDLFCARPAVKGLPRPWFLG